MSAFLAYQLAYLKRQGVFRSVTIVDSLSSQESANILASEYKAFRSVSTQTPDAQAYMEERFDSRSIDVIFSSFQTVTAELYAASRMISAQPYRHRSQAGQHLLPFIIQRYRPIFRYAFAPSDEHTTLEKGYLERVQAVEAELAREGVHIIRNQQMSDYLKRRQGGTGLDRSWILVHAPNLAWFGIHSQPDLLVRTARDSVTAPKEAASLVDDLSHALGIDAYATVIVPYNNEDMRREADFMNAMKKRLGSRLQQAQLNPDIPPVFRIAERLQVGGSLEVADFFILADSSYFRKSEVLSEVPPFFSVEVDFYQFQTK